MAAEKSSPAPAQPSEASQAVAETVESEMVPNQFYIRRRSYYRRRVYFVRRPRRVYYYRRPRRYFIVRRRRFR